MSKTNLNKFNSWNQYYHGHTNSISNLLLHWQYLLRILLLQPKSILEIGCGPAEHSLFIKKLLPIINLYLLDQDQQLLSKVYNQNKKDIKKIFISDVTLSAKLKSNKLPITDLIISQGLMEHFNDRDFITIINNFRPYTKRFLFSIPSEQYPTRDYGNEILRSKSQITNLLSRLNKVNYSAKYYFDIGIRTKLLSKQLLTSSNHLLVEISYI